jgi:sugar/nucleoside kinase (ribokinase family)
MSDASSPPAVDVVGIGNALVDVLSHASTEFVDSQGIVPGSMNLIDEDRRRTLYAATGPGVEISGGSVANSTVGVASFGGSSHYLGRVRDDQLGAVFAHDIRSVGVGFTNALAPDGPATGCSLILVTPDGERTMNTYLGAAELFGPGDVDADAVAAGRILYLEGYLFDRDEAKAAFEYAASVAHDAGRKVALTLSDSFCVERHRPSFQALLDAHVDVLFANTGELLALYEVDDVDLAIDKVRGVADVVAVTCGVDGSIIVTPDRTVRVAAEPVAHVVDTTGAGDLYAAGFLYGLARGLDLADCGRLGSIAAAEVISHVGARPEAVLADLIPASMDAAR